MDYKTVFQDISLHLKVGGVLEMTLRLEAEVRWIKTCSKGHYLK